MLASAFDVLMSNAPLQKSCSKKRKSEFGSQTRNGKKSCSKKCGSQTHTVREEDLEEKLQENIQKSRSDQIGETHGADLWSIKELEESSSNQTGSGNADSISSSRTGLVNADSIRSSKTGLVNADSISSSGTGLVNADSIHSSNADLISPDESVLELKKKSVNFKVKRAVCWGEGEKVPFIFVAKAFDAILKESSRTAITEIVCNLLRTVMETTPDDLLAVVYLLANRIAPVHHGLELGIGDSLISNALSEACGTNISHVQTRYKELGDLGLVAKAIRSSQRLMCKPEALTVAKVFKTFRSIAEASGRNSQVKKKNHIKALLVAALDCEPLYLIRLLQKKLRIGFAEQTLLAALGRAAAYYDEHLNRLSEAGHSLEEAEKIVKQAYSVVPVYDKIVLALLSGDLWNLPTTCCISLGIPVEPMSAKPAKRVSEIVEKFQGMEFTCEYKYDGERAQIHFAEEDGIVEIYSRNGERNTDKFPDVVAAVKRLRKPFVTSFVLDCELVAYDLEKQKILPLQVLRKRSQKKVIMSNIKIHVCIFAFDILFVNSQILMSEQLNVRREYLYKSFQEEPGFLQFATAVTSTDVEEIQNFLGDAVNSSCEGLVTKTLNKNATYEPSKESLNWVKLKKDYMEGIGDSLDLVPIAAFYGKGKLAGVYGAFLLACYDSDKEEFQSICKIALGASASPRSKEIPIPKSYYRFSNTISPDVWFEPSEVWEVKGSDLTISPVYCAAVGVVHPDKGISVRSPRVVRVREDKNPEQATSSDMVAYMYNAQKNNQKESQR